MTLPASPPIKASDINVELGRSAGAAFDINGATERALAGVPSGAIGFSNFLGKSSVGIEQMYVSPAQAQSFLSVPLGAVSGSDQRRIVVLVWHGGTATNPGTTPTCTIGGSGITRVAADSTGNGISLATGSAIFIGNPVGTSATVAVNWGSLNVGIVVLRLTGYTSTVVASGAEAGTGSNGQLNLATSSGGCIIGISGGQFSSFSNVTARGNDALLPNSIERAWGWDTGKTGASVNFTTLPWITTQGAHSMAGATFGIT